MQAFTVFTRAQYMKAQDKARIEFEYSLAVIVARHESAMKEYETYSNFAETWAITAADTRILCRCVAEYCAMRAAHDARYWPNGNPAE